MNEAQLQAFIEATRTTFETMLGVEVTPGPVETGRGAAGGNDVSGIIGLSRFAEADGSMVLSFREDVARRVVGWILGADEELPVMDQDVADGIGELVNVVAGCAKEGLAGAGVADCRTSLPSVILGSQHRVFHRRNVTRYAVGFTSEVGEFVLQVLLTKASRVAADAEQGEIQ